MLSPTELRTVRSKFTWWPRRDTEESVPDAWATKQKMLKLDISSACLGSHVLARNAA